MARRRFQRGHLRLRGDKWVGMWREDVLLPDGTVKRVRKSEIIGTRQDYKTKHLATRGLTDRLKTINSLTYKPRPTATFAEFAAGPMAPPIWRIRCGRMEGWAGPPVDNSRPLRLRLLKWA